MESSKRCVKLFSLIFILKGISHTGKTDRAVSTCQTLLSRSYVSSGEVAHVMGLLLSSLPAVLYGPLFYRNIEIDKIEKGQLLSTFASREDLTWWIRNLPRAY